MRALLVLSTFALAAATVWAQDEAPQEKAKAEKAAATAETLIDRLGHDDYAVREDATKKLIAMGAKAVPALEKALKSDDLEVRLRAGRALRAIRGDAARAGSDREPVDERGKRGPRRGQIFPGNGMGSQTQIEMTDGKVKVTVTETKDGKRTVKTYEGESLEELKKKHPELRDKLGTFRFRTLGRDRLDTDRFFKDFWDSDLRKEMQEMERLWERMRRARGNSLRGWRGGLVQPGQSILGARVSAPSPVLNAQLGLRGRGLVVQMVEKGSLADRLGLEKYDILLSLNDQAVKSPNEVLGLLRRMQAGAPLKARIMRAGETKDLTTTR